MFQAWHSVEKLLATDILRERNHFLYQACEEYGFTFIDNGAVKHRYLWNDCVQLLKNSKTIIANNLMHNINHFLNITNQFIWNQ